MMPLESRYTLPLAWANRTDEKRPNASIPCKPVTANKS